MDGNIAAVAAINEMLLQSWGGRIRVFPSLPHDWQEARFDGLLAEGGIEVSAVRANGATMAVGLVSPKKRQVRLRNPFGSHTVYQDAKELSRDASGDILIDLVPDEEVWITPSPGDTNLSWRDNEVPRQQNACNPYGMKETDAHWLSAPEGHAGPHRFFRTTYIRHNRKQ